MRSLALSPPLPPPPGLSRDEGGMAGSVPLRRSAAPAGGRPALPGGGGMEKGDGVSET